MILADKITEERKKNGWSQEELANQLGDTCSISISGKVQVWNRYVLIGCLGKVMLHKRCV